MNGTIRRHIRVEQRGQSYPTAFKEEVTVLVTATRRSKDKGKGGGKDTSLGRHLSPTRWFNVIYVRRKNKAIRRDTERKVLR